MGNSVGNLNQNDSNSVSINNNNNNSKTIYDTPTTVNILKALFESENYCFGTLSSKDHPLLVQKTIEKSKQQDSIKSIPLNGDPILHEFVNSLYAIFSNFLSTKDISKTTTDGMVKYEIHSVQSLNPTTIDNQPKSIWLPKSTTVGEAHRILSSILYSSDINTIPVDLADYVLVYENIMISLENQNKELYEEILKLSFRLNRFVVPPFRLLVIHKSHLLLLERKESKPLLTENEPISILQLIMFHLITNNIHSSENESERAMTHYSTSDKDKDHQYWPINEVKIGITPSSQLTHPLKYNKLGQVISKMIETNNISIGAPTGINDYLKILEMIFIAVNADISHIKLILPSLSKLIQVYDYPLLVALPYDRLLLAEFVKSHCSDDRWPQGIMVDGKYYSLRNNRFTPMLQLKINRGSIIHLRFNYQPDTIIDRSVSSYQTDEFEPSYRHEEVSNFNTDKFTPTKYQSSAECDNNTVHLMFPSQAIDRIASRQQLENKPQCLAIMPHVIHSNKISALLKSSNNWIDSSTKIKESRMQMAILGAERTDNIQPSEKDSSTQHLSIDDNKLALAIQTSLTLATLVNQPSVSSLASTDKPACLNCLSYLTDDNLECPYCLQIFCRICIESSYDDVTRAHCCPKCYNQVNLSEYRKSTIIGKFEKEGISALQCLNCKSMSYHHRLCLDPKCSALFCDDCCMKANGDQSFTTEASNSLKRIKCPQCKNSDTYVSRTVAYYIVRVLEYKRAQESESRLLELTKRKSFTNTAWKHEDFLPEKGTLEENRNRIISVIQFDGDHIQFGDERENRPILLINEPPEYACPESLQLSYWNTENDINRWENDKNVQFYKYNQSSIAAYIPHFSSFTARNTRFTENIMLDMSFLDTKYDYDFTTIDDTGKTFKRGQESYKRPCGWYRKAIRVLGKFGDETWLGTGVDAWPVAYHGTTTANALSILRNGLLVGGSNDIRIANGTVYGRGIYISPDPSYSGDKYYAKPLLVNGRQYQTMFQVRIKSSSVTKHNSNIWTCDNSQDVRPYGILFKEV